MTDYRFSQKKVITKRGVIWLGQTCNLQCHFCYFIDRINTSTHPEHPFMSLEKAKKICRCLVDTYGNTSVDIQGGEPTIYPGILDLVRYCNEIGLIPTLITNGLVLDNADRCSKFKEAGVRDFLISVHGIGPTYDSIVGVKNAHIRQINALDNLKNLGIPFRFNCVLSKQALSQLTLIAQTAIDYGARVVNFIAFNPFEDQQKKNKRSIENVPSYSAVAEKLSKAIDLLEQSHIEVNVRYFPLCLVREDHRKNIYNFQQLPYDTHEWDYASWSWTGRLEQRIKEGDTSPPISLEESSRSPIRLLRTLQPLTDWLNDKLSSYPGLRSKAKQIYDTIQTPIRKKDVSEKNLEDLYRNNAKIRAELHCRYKYSKSCMACAAKLICDGFHGDYAAIFGTKEAKAINHIHKIDNPLHFISQQEKVIDEKDFHWAL